MDTDVHYTVTGSGKPLLFIHGWAMHRGVWQSLTTVLREYCQVIAVDLRGHGTARTTSGPYDFSTFADDIRQLGTRLNLSSVTAAGWSMGVSVLLQLMQQPPSFIDSLVFISGTPCFVKHDDFPFGLPRIVVQRLQNRIGRDYPSALTSFHALLLTERERERFGTSPNYELLVHPRYAPSQEAAIQSLRSLVDSDFRNILGTISVPTLLLHGDADRLCLPEAATLMHDRIHTSHLVLLCNTGHVPFITKQHEVAAAVQDFIRDLS